MYETPYKFNFLVQCIEEWPYMPRRKVHLSRILHMSKTNQKGDVLWRKEEKDIVTAILWSSPPTSWSLCLKNSLNPKLYLYEIKYRCHLFFLFPHCCSALVRKLISNVSELCSISTLPKCLSQLCETFNISWKVSICPRKTPTAFTRFWNMGTKCNFRFHTTAFGARTMPQLTPLK